MRSMDHPVKACRIRQVIVGIAVFSFFSSQVLCATNTETEDTDKDGKADRWITRDVNGTIQEIASDRHKDGKPDYWLFCRGGRIYKREWDRNFDGKADFRTYEDYGRLLEKQYDDNFDGKFEKTTKSPARGSSGKIKTENTENA